MVFGKSGRQQRNESFLPFGVEADLGLVYHYQAVILNLSCNPQHRKYDRLLAGTCLLDANRSSGGAHLEQTEIPEVDETKAPKHLNVLK